MTALTLDAFRAENKRPGFACALSQFVATLSEADRQVIAEAFADLSIQASSIHRVLQDRGYAGGKLTIQTHRRDRCQSCWAAGFPWAR